MKDPQKLNQKITLSSPVSVNTTGEPTKTWSPQGDMWAEILQLKGEEAMLAARETARETIRARVRYRADLTTAWRILWNGQFYYVKSVDRSANREGELWFTAELVGAA
jgi:SPP1 family predicted phage head-tail adaptor